MLVPAQGPLGPMSEVHVVLHIWEYMFVSVTYILQYIVPQLYYNF